MHLYAHPFQIFILMSKIVFAYRILIESFIKNFKSYIRIKNG